MALLQRLAADLEPSPPEKDLTITADYKSPDDAVYVDLSSANISASSIASASFPSPATSTPSPSSVPSKPNFQLSPVSSNRKRPARIKVKLAPQLLQHKDQPSTVLIDLEANAATHRAKPSLPKEIKISVNVAKKIKLEPALGGRWTQSQAILHKTNGAQVQGVVLTRVSINGGSPSSTTSSLAEVSLPLSAESSEGPRSATPSFFPSFQEYLCPVEAPPPDICPVSQNATHESMSLDYVLSVIKDIEKEESRENAPANAVLEFPSKPQTPAPNLETQASPNPDPPKRRWPKRPPPLPPRRPNRNKPESDTDKPSSTISKEQTKEETLATKSPKSSLSTSNNFETHSPDSPSTSQPTDKLAAESNSPPSSPDSSTSFKEKDTSLCQIIKTIEPFETPTYNNYDNMVLEDAASVFPVDLMHLIGDEAQDLAPFAATPYHNDDGDIAYYACDPNDDTALFEKIRAELPDDRNIAEHTKEITVESVYQNLVQDIPELVSEFEPENDAKYKAVLEEIKNCAIHESTDDKSITTVHDIDAAIQDLPTEILDYMHENDTEAPPNIDRQERALFLVDPDKNNGATMVADQFGTFTSSEASPEDALFADVTEPTNIQLSEEDQLLLADFLNFTLGKNEPASTIMQEKTVIVNGIEVPYDLAQNILRCKKVRGCARTHTAYRAERGRLLQSSTNEWSQDFEPQKQVQTFPCLFENCKAVFDSQTSLRKHSVLHKDKTFKCDYCEKAFQTSTQVKRHMLTHGPKDAVECLYPGCTKKFAQVANMKKHLRTHDPTNVRNYVCPECGKSFSSKPNVVRHQASHRKVQALWTDDL